MKWNWFELIVFPDQLKCPLTNCKTLSFCTSDFFTFHLVRSIQINSKIRNEKSLVSCFHFVSITQLLGTVSTSPPLHSLHLSTVTSLDCWPRLVNQICEEPPHVFCCVSFQIYLVWFYWSTRLVLWPLNYWTWWAGGKNIKCLSRKILISAVCCLIDKICWETFIVHFSRAAALQAVRDVRPQSELQPCSERREASVWAAALQLCCSSASQEVTPPPSPSSLISL